MPHTLNHFGNLMNACMGQAPNVFTLHGRRSQYITTSDGADIAATEHAIVPTAAQASADNIPREGLPEQGSMPNPDPQYVSAENRKQTSGNVVVT